MGVQEYDTSPGNNTTINGIAITGSSSIKNGDNALRQLMADTATGIRDGSYTANGYVAKAAGYTVVAADRGKIIDCTAALTLSLTAAATVGAGFVFIVKANGGAVTVDPNGAENINGASASLVIPDGSFAIIACTGAAWHSLGQSSPRVDAKSANYTVLATDNGKAITVDATSGARTITLPAAATAGNGFKLIVKKVDASANTVTIDPNAAELLDGAATKVLRLTKQAAALICDGTAWHVLSDGSTFERGSNANGEYVRFADGTQICTHTVTGGSNWTYPAAFSAAPTFSAVGYGVNSARSVVPRDATTTLVTVNAYTADTSSSTVLVNITAIGRWF